MTSGYILFVGTSPGSYSQTINVGMVTSHSITNLADGTTYYFALRAYNASGQQGPLSAEVTGVAGSPTLPGPPSNLTAAVRSGTVVDLAWQAPAGTVTGYRIEVGTAAGLSNVATLNTGTATTFTVNAPAAGTYYVRVRSINTAGTSTPSNEVVVTLATSTGAAPPSNLTANVRRRRHIDLAWQTPSTGASSYNIEVGTAPGGSNVRITTTASTGLTISDLPTGAYYIRGRSVLGSQVSAPSNEVRVEVIRGGKPLPPTSLTATLRDSSLIDLTWVPDDEATYYRVEVGTSPNQTDVSSFTTGVTTSFTIGELPARTYYIRVRGANEAGFGDPSQEVVVAGVGGSNAPRRLAGSVNGAGAVRLTWDVPQDPTGVTGYVVEAGAGPGRSDLGVIPTNDRSLATGPIPNGTYFVRVRALTSAGAGPASNEVVLHVGAAQQCTAPPVAPRLETNVVGSLLELTWSPGVGDPPTGYVLDVGSTPGRRDIVSMPLAAEVTSLTAQAPDGTYALRLIAVNSCGASTWGSDTSVTIGGPQIALPGAPSSLAQQVTGRSATLTWAPPTTGGEPSSYVIEVLIGSQMILSLDTGNLSTTFTHGDVPPGEYTVRVRAVNGRGAGDPSNSVIVSVP